MTRYEYPYCHFVKEISEKFRQLDELLRDLSSFILAISIHKAPPVVGHISKLWRNEEIVPDFKDLVW